MRLNDRCVWSKHQRFPSFLLTHKNLEMPLIRTTDMICVTWSVAVWVIQDRWNKSTLPYAVRNTSLELGDETYTSLNWEFFFIVYMYVCDDNLCNHMHARVKLIILCVDRAYGQKTPLFPSPWAMRWFWSAHKETQSFYRVEATIATSKHLHGLPLMSSCCMMGQLQPASADKIPYTRSGSHEIYIVHCLLWRKSLCSPMHSCTCTVWLCAH